MRSIKYLVILFYLLLTTHLYAQQAVWTKEYAWGCCKKPYNGEPPLWFHDIYRPNVQPYKQEEVALIRQLIQRHKKVKKELEPAAAN